MHRAVNTFVFADLAGYTALTEAHGDEVAADIATGFCRALNERLPEDADDLKMLGDACLLRFGGAAEAIELGLDLTSGFAPRHEFPHVRVGMDTGSAVRRGEDWFGSTLNIAARVAALAGPGDVLLTQATRDAAGAAPGAAFEDLGAHELRHLSGKIHLFRARREDAVAVGEAWAVDPVCHMRLDPKRAAASVVHQGTEMIFCSESCAQRFSRSPERYLQKVDPGLERP